MDNKLRLGVVGYSPLTNFCEWEAKIILRDAYNLVEMDFPGREITVVSGLTDGGIMKLAYEEAKKRKWRTAGIACERVRRYILFPVDEEPVIVGEKWGDESETFVKSIDALVRVGLGKQAKREAEMLKKMGKKTYEYDLPPII